MHFATAVTRFYIDFHKTWRLLNQIWGLWQDCLRDQGSGDSNTNLIDTKQIQDIWVSRLFAKEMGCTWMTLLYLTTSPSSFLFSDSFCFCSSSAACWTRHKFTLSFRMLMQMQMKINIQIVLKGLPVTSWTGLPVCCCFLVFLVLPSRTASGLSIYSWDTPWKGNLRRRRDIQTHDFLSVSQKLLMWRNCPLPITYEQPDLLKQIKAPLKPQCCVTQHWEQGIWSAIAVFQKYLGVCVSVCLCITLN